MPAAGARRHRVVFPGLAEMSEGRHGLAVDLAANRQRLGLSQTELAARMGTSQSAVARIESGEADIRLSTLQRYTAALGQRLEWQIGRPEDDQPDRERGDEEMGGVSRLNRE